MLPLAQRNSRGQEKYKSRKAGRGLQPQRMCHRSRSDSGREQLKIIIKKGTAEGWLSGMIDRENVIDNLEQNIRWIEEIECHQFPGWGNVTMAMRDAVELLKEQEAIKPAPGMLCGQCGCRIYRGANYCYNCGRKVKWDAAD